MPIHLHTNRIDEGPHDGITRRNRLAWVLRTGNSMPGKILLVEDNLWNRESIAYFLRQEGYEVKEASNGNGAVQLLDENEFDLVLSDVVMPGPSGFHLLQHARLLAPRTPVLLMSGFFLDPRQILKQGATDFIMKPFELNDLLSKIKRALECQ